MKRTFVLLEVLIAFSLVSLTILPFIRFPYTHMKKQIDLCFEQQIEKIAQRDLIDVQVLLYKKKEVEPTMEEIEIKISDSIRKKIFKKMSISTKREKKDPAGAIISFVTIKVKYFNSKKEIKPIHVASAQVILKKKL